MLSDVEPEFAQWGLPATFWSQSVCSRELETATTTPVVGLPTSPNTRVQCTADRLQCNNGMSKGEHQVGWQEVTQGTNPTGVETLAWTRTASLGCPVGHHACCLSCFCCVLPYFFVYFLVPCASVVLLTLPSTALCHFLPLFDFPPVSPLHSPLTVD